MSKALKHYIVYIGSSGWWHSENLSVQEWVNKIDHNMNSLCQLGRAAHIPYSANLVVCAKVGESGEIPPMLINSTSPQILIGTVKGVTINIVTFPVYDRVNVRLSVISPLHQIATPNRHCRQPFRHSPLPFRHCHFATPPLFTANWPLFISNRWLNKVLPNCSQ